jgi:hypothetical protein
MARESYCWKDSYIILYEHTKLDLNKNMHYAVLQYRPVVASHT